MESGLPLWVAAFQRIDYPLFRGGINGGGRLKRELDIYLM